jgi:hypothetical protein
MEPCRPIGEGFYSIVNQGNTAHLAYVLEVPNGNSTILIFFLHSEIGSVQREFNVEKEGVFYLAVKNPRDPSLNLPGIPGLSEPTHVEFPAEIQASFSGRSWAPPIPVAMLSYRGVELVLIGESNDVVKQFGTTGEMIEKEEQIDARNVSAHSIYKILRMDNQHPIQPLF